MIKQHFITSSHCTVLALSVIVPNFSPPLSWPINQLPIPIGYMSSPLLHCCCCSVRKQPSENESEKEVTSAFETRVQLTFAKFVHSGCFFISTPLIATTTNRADTFFFSIHDRLEISSLKYVPLGKKILSSPQCTCTCERLCDGVCSLFAFFFSVHLVAKLMAETKGQRE